MPDLIRHPVSFYMALKRHFVPHPLSAKGQASGNDNRGVFNCRSDMKHSKDEHPTSNAEHRTSNEKNLNKNVQLR
mgnify:CR=1 FL=1